jgi:hypothetical protein
MSHADHPAPSDPLSYASPATLGPAGPMLPQVAAALGIASTFLGVAIFIAACFGLTAAFAFSILPFGLGIAGFVLSIAAGIFYRSRLVDTQVLASLFTSLFGVIGGLLEIAAWQGWSVLGK